MTTHAVRAKLASVDVRMARCTIGFLFGENKILVTCFALDCQVFSDKREPRRVMIELGIFPQRPGRGRVAGLTRDVDLPVRRLLRGRIREAEKKQDRYPHDHFFPSREWHDSHFIDRGLYRTKILSPSFSS